MSEERAKSDALVKTASPWEVLWGRVRLTFTDDDEERYQKRCRLRDKCMRKHDLEKVPVDEDALKAAMVEYSETLKHNESLAKHGVTAVDMAVADKYCPEVMMVREFVRRMRNASRDEDRGDKIDRWEDALDTKATDHLGVSKADSRAAMFLLERIDRRAFGKEPPKEAGVEGKSLGGGIQINLIGDAAVKLLTRPEGKRSGGVIVDV